MFIGNDLPARDDFFFVLFSDLFKNNNKVRWKMFSPTVERAFFKQQFLRINNEICSFVVIVAGSCRCFFYR